MNRSEIIKIIEDGQQVGFEKYIECDGKTYCITVGIQKHAGNYKTIYHYIEINLKSSPYEESKQDIWENRIFSTLKESENFILSRSKITLEELHKPIPAKGKKNEGFFHISDFY